MYDHFATQPNMVSTNICFEELSFEIYSSLIIENDFECIDNHSQDV